MPSRAQLPLLLSPTLLRVSRGVAPSSGDFVALVMDDQRTAEERFARLDWLVEEYRVKTEAAVEEAEQTLIRCIVRRERVRDYIRKVRGE